MHQLTFLAHAWGLGFSIEDCCALLALWADGDYASSDVRQIAKSHLAAIDVKIADLHAMRETLSDLVSACAGDDRPDCPILQNLGKTA